MLEIVGFLFITAGFWFFGRSVRRTWAYMKTWYREG